MASIGEDGAYEVREPVLPYGRDSAPRNRFLRLNNTYFLNAYPDILIGVLGPTPTGDWKPSYNQRRQGCGRRDEACRDETQT